MKPNTSAILSECWEATKNDRVPVRELCVRLLCSGFNTNDDFGFSRSEASFSEFLVEHAERDVWFGDLSERQQNWLSMAKDKVVSAYRVREGLFGSKVRNIKGDPR
jgi:hypothetical protein